jgi:hypothetical protein
MALTDELKRNADRGFVKSFDQKSARRQLKISLMVVFILAVSVLALGTTIQFDTASNAAQLYDLRLDPNHAARFGADG